MEYRCPECKRKNILYRVRTNSFYCRNCGAEWKKEEKETNKE